MSNLGPWIGAFLTIGLFSWMYKENAWFRVVEHVFVGASLGHLAITGYQNVLDTAWVPASSGENPTMFIPIVVGLLLFSRWSAKHAWMSRVPMGFLVGTTAAVSLSGAIKAQLVEQVVATMMPLNSVNNVIFFIITVAATMYFLICYSLSWSVKRLHQKIAIIR